MENKVLAVVNGKEITQVDFDNTILRFPQERRAFLQTEQGKKQLLEQIISFELIYNYAKDEDMEDESEFIVQFEAMKKELLTQYVISKAFSEVNVSDSEAEDYYNVNKERFKTQESVSAKHILVDTDKKAAEVAKAINDGMTFENAAKEYSSCPSSEQGGELGTFTRGQMVPEFEEAAFSLPIGVVSEPVKTQFGYHLIKVEKKNESKVSPFGEVKESIKNELLQKRQNMKYSQLLEELNKRYTVTIK